MRVGEDLSRRLDEIAIAVGFLTRVPPPRTAPVGEGDVARALWAGPLVGAAVGVAGAAAYGALHAAGVPDFPAAAVAVAATAAVTGALHEDGLADVADGFGGATRERKLAIMRDSRIGTFGVCALALSFLLRIGSLASLQRGVLVLAALVAAHAAARAVLPAFMRLVPPARTDGMSAHAGRPPPAVAAIAGVLGVAALLVCLGAAATLVAIVCVAAAFGLLAWLCRRQIGGQTGDVLGALEQITEVIVLLVAAAALRGATQI